MLRQPAVVGYPTSYRGQADMVGVTEFLNDRGYPRTTRRAYSDVLRVVLTRFEGRDLAAVTRADFLLVKGVDEVQSQYSQALDVDDVRSALERVA